MSKKNKALLDQAIDTLLQTARHQREAEIIKRRFGIDCNKQTLEQIGEEFSITRERVRQIEKTTTLRLRIRLSDDDISLPSPESRSLFTQVEAKMISTLHEMGRASRLDTICKKLFGENSEACMAKVIFLIELSRKVILINENDQFYRSVVITDDRVERTIRERIYELIQIIKDNGEPMSIDDIFNTALKTNPELIIEHPKEIAALLSVSKHTATLNGKWGLSKWSSVNPRNIRDKIYIVLQAHSEPMHFTEIADEIRYGQFEGSPVTDQAIHNELIKDDRFVLVGRGVYGLRERGFEPGSISDVITRLLKKTSPMHRDDIICHVLKVRRVQEATILLNLQNKSLFKRVEKDLYAINDKPQEAEKIIKVPSIDTTKNAGINPIKERLLKGFGNNRKKR